MLRQLCRPLRLLQLSFVFVFAVYLFQQYRDPGTWRERGVPFEPRTFKVGEHVPTPLHFETCSQDSLTFVETTDTIHLLVFWASWCHTCVHEFSEFEQLLKKFPRIKLLAVQVDGLPGRIQIPGGHSFEANQASFACDPKGILAEAFQVSALPHAFVLGPDGRILHTVEGDGAWVSASMRARFESWLSETRTQKP